MLGRLLRSWVVAASICSGQPGDLKQLLEEGFRLYSRNEMDAARQQFERVLALAREAKQNGAEGEAHRMLGQILNFKAQYPAARAELEQALAIFQDASYHLGMGRVYQALGYTSWGMGDREQARECYRKSLAEFEAAGDLSQIANAAYNLAFLEPGYEEPVKLIRRGLELARQIGNQPLEGDLLHLWADRDFDKGDFATAAEKLEQAALIHEKTGARHKLARVWTSMGRVQRAHGHPERAIEFYRRAWKLQEELGDQQGVIQSVDIIGSAYAHMGQHRQALEYYQRAVALARKTGSPRLVSASLANLAGCYIKLGEYGRALGLLEEVLREGPADEVIVRINLSAAYAGLGRHREALESADRAVVLARQQEHGEFLISALTGRSDTNQKRGLTAEALADTREALGVIEQLRGRLVPSDFMKRGFAERCRELFASAIKLLHQAGEHREAFEIAEQARARAFLDLLATREMQAKPADRLQLAALRETEKELKAIGMDPSAPRAAVTYSLLMRGGHPELASVWKKWQGADPELKSLMTAAPLSAGQMAATAARLRSTVLAYWVNPEATYLWVVGPKGDVRSLRIEVSAERLRRLIRETWTAGNGSARPSPLARGGDALLLDETQKKAWRELYRLLIRPARSVLPTTAGSRLTIVPHGPLFQVSFAALLDDSDRYLVEKYTLHYAPAGAVLDFTERKKQRSSGRPARYLVVADPAGLPVMPDGKRLPSLPGSRREAQAIARLLPGRAVTLLAGAQASKENVRALVPDKSVLHFATHGILRDDRPFDSFLALAGDGRLTAQEIYDLDLEADLVVLSACRTGLGQITGDGILGLTRAFFYAGTPSVVATLWDVADEPTFLLVSEFYRSLHRLHDKSRALRAAQLRLLAALRAGQVKVATPAGSLVLPEHPVFWAGFALMGEP